MRHNLGHSKLLIPSILFAIRSFTNSAEGGVSVPNLPKGAAVNLFTNGILFDLHVFLSEDPEFVDFNDTGALIWTKKDLVYGDWESGPDGDGTYTFSTQIEASEALQNNGSIYLHSFVGKFCILSTAFPHKVSSLE